MIKYFKRLDSNKINISILFFIWIILIFIINPVGEFPFGDDFAYAKPVEHLLNTGEVRLTDWSSMTLVAQIYIGAIFTSIFGFSFTVLRFIGLISGIIGTIGVYCLTNLISNNKKIAFLTSLLIAFHPYYYLFSYSFTTDVPFFAFIIWSIYYYTKVIKENKLKYLIIAVTLNIIALLIRDLGIIIPAAFAIGYAIKYRVNSKTIIKIISPVFMVLLTFLLWRVWIEYFNGVTKNIDFSRNKMLTVWSNGIGYLLIIYAKNILYATIYIGIYGIPLTILLLKEYHSSLSKKLKYLLFTSLMISIPTLIILMLKWEKIYNDAADFLTSQIVGIIFFWLDVHYPSHESAFFFPSWFLFIIAAIGLAAGIYLIITLIQKSYDYYKLYNFKILKTNNGIVEFISLIIIFYLFIILSQYMFCRYLFLPLILIYILSTYKFALTRKNTFLIKLIFYSFLIYNVYNSVSAAHDMMSYNKARWEALNYLNNELNVKPEQIDGGFEYNAWHFYDYNYIPTNTKNWWWVQDDKYIVTWGKINGYETIREYEYIRWYPLGFIGKAYISKRFKLETTIQSN